MPSDDTAKTTDRVTPKPPRPWTELPRRAWITGAGKGIGRELAKRLATEGWTVIASARTEGDLKSLAEEAADLAGGIEPMVLDVTDAAAADAAVEKLLAGGPLGLVVLNAGTHTPTPVEDFDVETVGRLVDVNMMGTVNCLAPTMRALRRQGFGKIAVVASVAGYRGLPKAAAYCATKAGLMGMCQALYPELRRDGVALAVINPGFVKTPLTDRNEFPMPFLMPVEKAVDAIMRGLASSRFEIAFPLRFVLILKVLRVLPDRIYFWLTAKMIGA